ncbi:MAG: HAD-IA family hydrolase [Gordonia sp. (in: high G+C Gram-positive bacteria)]|uniref:HAD family hydrolase n=1 Tax=Gordonia sp. (in: high G+C Gram-positive bacteria) TaxID=84139 RepID=UPI003BB6620A
MLGLPAQITVALFDLDGVLTTTATAHRAAWTEAFDAFLSTQVDQPPFTEQDYLDYVDGRPRMDGVRTFLAARGIVVPDDVAEGIGAAKNALFVAEVARGVDPYPGSVRYLNAARDAGLRIAVVTSSKNGAAVLEAAGLTGFVEERVDGNTIVEENLNGKPAPDSYLRGAELMGATPAQAAVFEDAISGVQAGAAGDFGYVVGIDRVGGNQAESMMAAGASVVVTDLDELL